MKLKLFILLLFVFCFPLAFYPQSASLSKDEKKAQKEANKKEREQVEKILNAYKTCRLDGGFFISNTSRIRKNDLRYLARATRPVNEKDDFSKADPNRINSANGIVFEGVSSTDSYALTIGEEPYYFATIRVDRSNKADYESDKEILIKWINYINSRRNSETNFAKETYFDFFETYSSNRITFPDNKPTEIGITLLFDDKNFIWLTVYFFNQPPKLRLFSNIEEWKVLHDKLLNSYTKCVKENLKSITATQVSGS